MGPRRHLKWSLLGSMCKRDLESVQEEDFLLPCVQKMFNTKLSRKPCVPQVFYNQGHLRSCDQIVAFDEGFVRQSAKQLWFGM